jgi:hypothetical protein
LGVVLSEPFVGYSLVGDNLKMVAVINPPARCWLLSYWLGSEEVMDSAKHCQDQSAECLRLKGLAQSEAETEVLRNLSHSWSRLAGQIDRYNALVRDQRRAVQK